MTEKPRSQWTAVEIAAHAMEATSLSQITLPEVKRMAARILAGERGVVQSDPMLTGAELVKGMRDYLAEG